MTNIWIPKKEAEASELNHNRYFAKLNYMYILTYYDLKKALNELTGDDLGKAVIFKDGNKSFTVKEFRGQDGTMILVSAYQVPNFKKIV